MKLAKLRGMNALSGVVWGLLLGSPIASGCQRAPEEPVAAHAVSAENAQRPVPETPKPSFTVPPNRCVEPTPNGLPLPVEPGPDSRCPLDPDPPSPPMPVVHVQFPDAAKAGTGLDVELARTPYERERGLMYRRAMDSDRGMLFRMDERTIHEFWMRNTCIPLDMMFVDGDGLIVGLLENVPTMNERQRGVRCKSRYIIEANAGWARRHGVKAGERVEIPPEVAGN